MSTITYIEAISKGLREEMRTFSHGFLEVEGEPAEVKSDISLEGEEFFEGGFEEQMTYDEACLILGLNRSYVRLDIKILSNSTVGMRGLRRW